MSERPKVLLSACLEHCKCRYDGSVIQNATVLALKSYVDFDIVCPEMGIGLPSPREAIRLVKDNDRTLLVDSYTGTDRTEAMDQFIDAFLSKHPQEDYDGVLLKCKSPTCGLKDVKLYSGPGKIPSLPEKGQGIFGARCKKHFSNLPIEDEGRLKHFNLREHFFMGLFLHHAFRQVKQEVLALKTLHPLVDFHAKNKYLYMTYHNLALKHMGSIVANHAHLSREEVLKRYEEAMVPIYSANPSVGKNVNTLLHVFGYFKESLSSVEKAFFLDQLNRYQEKKLPFSTLLMLLKSYVVRFDEPYLKKQTLFDMFPEALIELTDSGKGI